MALLGMPYLIYFMDRSICEERYVDEFLELPIRGEIDTWVSWCSSVLLDMRQTCMYELDWDFSTCGTEDLRFYYGTVAFKVASI